MSNSKQKAILVEFFQEKSGLLTIFSLFASDRPELNYANQYDVDWCKRDGMYCYHESGCGPFQAKASGIYWSLPGLKVQEEPCRLADKESRWWNKTRRVELPDFLKGLDVLEWLWENGHESDTEYCSICDDHLPTDDPCPHIWFCNGSGEYSTPNNRVVCQDKNCDCADANPVQYSSKVEA